MKNERLKIFWLTVIAIAGMFAIIVQFLYYLDRPGAGPVENVIRYFSYFTIQTNILITVCAACLIVKPASKWGSFFSRATVRSALTVYIIIVSLVYNLILRSLYHLVGLEAFANNLLHVVIPVLFVMYWIIFQPKDQLTWNVFPNLIYPLLYAAYILIRGGFSGYYPYPFLNVAKNGYPAVSLNLFFLLLLFLIISLILVMIAKLFYKRLPGR